MTAAPASALSALLVLAKHAAAAESRSPATNWFAFPVAFYMPETRFGFGAIGGVHFAFEPALQTSDVQLLAVGTMKEQALLDLWAQLFPFETLALGVAVKLAVFPDLYYGIGDDTSASAREAFTSRLAEVQLAAEAPERAYDSPATASMSASTQE
jgi:hypothetical protein